MLSDCMAFKARPSGFTASWILSQVIPLSTFMHFCSLSTEHTRLNCLMSRTIAPFTKACPPRLCPVPIMQTGIFSRCARCKTFRMSSTVLGVSIMRTTAA